MLVWYWVYPRGCGATTGLHKNIAELLGLSPRMRGYPIVIHHQTSIRGSIPAGAGLPLCYSVAGGGGEKARPGREQASENFGQHDITNIRKLAPGVSRGSCDGVVKSLGAPLEHVLSYLFGYSSSKMARWPDRLPTASVLLGMIAGAQQARATARLPAPNT